MNIQYALLVIISSSYIYAAIPESNFKQLEPQPQILKSGEVIGWLTVPPHRNIEKDDVLVKIENFSQSGGSIFGTIHYIHPAYPGINLEDASKKIHAVGLYFWKSVIEKIPGASEADIGKSTGALAHAQLSHRPGGKLFKYDNKNQIYVNAKDDDSPWRDSDYPHPSQTVAEWASDIGEITQKSHLQQFATEGEKRRASIPTIQKIMQNPPGVKFEQDKIRGEFFNDITGMLPNGDTITDAFESKAEEQFRNTIGKGYTNKKIQSLLNDLTERNKWIKEFPRRAAIFQGTYEVLTLKDLDNEIKKQNIGQLTPDPQFHILLYDPKKPELGDVRYFQSNKLFWGGVFQIASRNTALEGNSEKPHEGLVSILGSAVQGEDAASSAAGAFINRKYFRPIIELKDSIGLHDNVVVSGGYGIKTSKKAYDKQQYLVMNTTTVNGNIEIDLDNSQVITQVFTHAFDRPKGDAAIKKAKEMLKVAYLGTLKAAVVAHKPNILLTLVGGGAFRNDIAWIGEVITSKEFIDTINKHGLRVTLLYRPDKIRQEPVRTAEGDIDFLDKVIKVAHKISSKKGSFTKDEETNIAQLVKEYVDAAYAYEQDKNDETQQAVSKAHNELTTSTIGYLFQHTLPYLQQPSVPLIIPTPKIPKIDLSAAFDKLFNDLKALHAVL